MKYSISMQLLNDFNNYEYSNTGAKALRVWNKCMRRGKVDLATKIEEKYGFLFPKDDIAIAFAMALFAAKNRENT